MPPAGAQVRSEQIALMASLRHKELTSRRFEKLLSKLISIETATIRVKGLTFEEKALLREWRRDFLHAVAIPNSFVKHFASLTSEAMTIWAKARKENAFSLFAPYLEEIIALSQQKAEFLGYKEHPYDALLDTFEPDLTSKKVSKLFITVKKGLIPLLRKILAAPQIDDSFLHGKFSIDKQMAFGKSLLDAMGYELDKGRLDLSTHPFSMSIHPSDSRITARIHPTSVLDCISVVLHEGGHSLYEMGLLPEYYGSPLCEATSLAIHESQSRLWETRIGQSKPFWKHFLPLLAKTFPQLQKVPFNSFYRAVNKVSPNYIRVESDEVTYTLHVILRYELEKQLIEGSLTVDELPSAWNASMENLLGIVPPTDTLGCLQDVHWSMGAFGYFPTYALGNLYASQFFEAMEKDFPDWEKRAASGDLSFLREWLRHKIHQHGRIYRAADLVKKVTGMTLTPEPYLKYLNQKYTEIYKLDV